MPVVALHSRALLQCRTYFESCGAIWYRITKILVRYFREWTTSFALTSNIFDIWRVYRSPWAASIAWDVSTSKNENRVCARCGIKNAAHVVKEWPFKNYFDCVPRKITLDTIALAALVTCANTIRRFNRRSEAAILSLLRTSSSWWSSRRARVRSFLCVTWVFFRSTIRSCFSSNIFMRLDSFASWRCISKFLCLQQCGHINQ